MSKGRAIKAISLQTMQYDIKLHFNDHYGRDDEGQIINLNSTFNIMIESSANEI